VPSHARKSAVARLGVTGHNKRLDARKVCRSVDLNGDVITRGAVQDKIDREESVLGDVLLLGSQAQRL
jgi:hypothetical protein